MTAIEELKNFHKSFKYMEDFQYRESAPHPYDVINDYSSSDGYYNTHGYNSFIQLCHKDNPGFKIEVNFTIIDTLEFTSNPKIDVDAIQCLVRFMVQGKNFTGHIYPYNLNPSNIKISEKNDIAKKYVSFKRHKEKNIFYDFTEDMNEKLEHLFSVIHQYLKDMSKDEYLVNIICKNAILIKDRKFIEKYLTKTLKQEFQDLITI